MEPGRWGTQDTDSSLIHTERRDVARNEKQIKREIRWDGLVQCLGWNGVQKEWAELWLGGNATGMRLNWGRRGQGMDWRGDGLGWSREWDEEGEDYKKLCGGWSWAGLERG